MSSPDYITVRQFRDGDEEEISRVFGRCYSRYSGYIPRDPHFWSWFNRDRPGLSGILVAEVEGRVVGSLTYVRGEVIDPCYDPEYNGGEIITALLGAAEELGRSKGISTITINVPENDFQMRSACEAAGMRPREVDKAYVISLFDIREVIRLILEKSKPRPGKYGMRILRSREEECFVIDVSDGSVTIKNGWDAPILISTDEGTLNEIVFNGRIGPLDLIFRRITVSPPWKILQGAWFLRSLILDVEWFSPRGAFF